MCGQKLESPEYAAADAVSSEVENVVETAAPEVAQTVEAAAPEVVTAAAAAPVYTEAAQAQAAAQTQAAAPAAAATQAAAPAKKSKKGLIIGLCVGGGALIILLLLLFLVILPLIRNRKVEVDLTPYAQAEAYGYDTVGDADATFDKDRFIEDYGDKIKYTKQYRSFGDDAAEFFTDFVYGYLDYDYGKLSNGDEVTYMMYVDPMIEDVFNVDIVGLEEDEDTLEIPVTISGLEEAEVIDPFEYINITVSGTSPYGELDYSFDNAPDAIKENEYAFSADKYYDLSNGDVVTFSLDEWYADDYFISYYGVIPSKTTYEYTVEGLDEFVTVTSQIKDTDVTYLKTVGDGFMEEIRNAETSNVRTDSFKMIGYILEVSKNPSYYSYNTIYAVYQQDCTVFDEAGASPSENFTDYRVLSFDNVVISDGALKVDESNWDVVYHYYTMELELWEISGSYGFASVDDVKSSLMSSTDYYTYEYVDVN